MIMITHHLQPLLLPLLASLPWLATTARSGDPTPGIPAHYQLVYAQSFQNPDALRDFVVSDTNLWRFSSEGTNGTLELFSTMPSDPAAKPGPRNTATRYKPVHRSPLGLALVADRLLGDFILDLDMQSTVPPYGHQDLCLFFNVQSPTQFYYVHLAVAADPNAHNIFIVNQAPRRNIALETTRGINWGERSWHRIRLERTTSDGAIKVYFDDLTKPIMRAEDKTFTRGLIGVGSFDDLGRFDNLRVWAPNIETTRTSFFERPAQHN